MRVSVHLQREMARLHFYDPSTSDRAIADAVALSPSTVGEFRKRLRGGPLEWQALQSLDDQAWRDALGTHDRSIAVKKPTPDFGWVHSEMQRPDATIEQIWREWREHHPDGVGLTQFGSGYRDWKKSLHVVMRQVHRPGEKLFVDFAGRTVPIKDVSGGPGQLAQIFVAVLGHSNFTFLHAVPSQTTTDWVQCHVKCFEYLGGAPTWVVSDNLKAAVWRRERDRVVINPAFRECLKHYDTAAAPARPRRPRDKAKAEVGVQIAQRWVLFRIRDREYFSIDELNADLRTLNEQMNDHPFRKLPATRRHRFEEAEKNALKPLPNQPYEICDWRYEVRIGDDYHVEHGRSYYSVPHHLAGARADLRYTRSVLEVFHCGRRVALHALAVEPGSVITLADHRPVNHQRALEGEPRELLEWAKSVGINTLKMITHHVQQRTDGHGLKAARRLRELAREYGDARFESMCEYALVRNIMTLRSVQSILSSKADMQPVHPSATHPRVRHPNVRGPEYFGT